MIIEVTAGGVGLILFGAALFVGNLCFLLYVHGACADLLKAYSQTDDGKVDRK